MAILSSGQGASPDLSAPVIAAVLQRVAGPKRCVAIMNGRYSWFNVTSDVCPPPRSHAHLAFDPASEEVVLWGPASEEATSSGHRYDEMWTWDGMSWRARSTKAPNVRGMAVAGTPDGVLAFGGQRRRRLSPKPAESDETLLWHLGEWVTLRPRTRPSPRHDAVMVYDSETGSTLLFGGLNGMRALGDTWRWDGTEWSELHPKLAPSPRSSALVFCDPGLGGVALTGGFSATILPTSQGLTLGTTDELWLWKGSEWERRPLLGSGPESPFCRAAFRSKSSELIAFGGIDAGHKRSLDETWIMSSTRWSPLGTALSPPGRIHPALAYDARNDNFVMFGGWRSRDDPVGELSRGDTWILRPDLGAA